MGVDGVVCIDVVVIVVGNCRIEDDIIRLNRLDDRLDDIHDVDIKAFEVRESRFQIQQLTPTIHV